MLFKMLLCIGVVACSSMAEPISKDEIARINAHLDSILISEIPGNPNGKVTKSVIEIKKILGQLGADRIIAENELNQLVATLNRTLGYENQKAIVLSKSDGLRFWSYQAKKVVSTVSGVKNQRDMANAFFPLLVDPQNMAQLLDPDLPDSSTGKTYTDSEVSDLTKRIKEAWPYKGQKIILQNRVANSRFSMNQIKRIIGIIDMPNDKKEVLTMILPSVIDPQNIDILFGIFWTDSDKKFLNGLMKKTFAPVDRR